MLEIPFALFKCQYFELLKKYDVRGKSLFVRESLWQVSQITGLSTLVKEYSTGEIRRDQGSGQMEFGVKELGQSVILHK